MSTNHSSPVTDTLLPTESALHNTIANALINGTTYSNVRQAAKDVMALIPAQCAPLPGLVSTLRSHADDCENMERWAVPELAPLLRRAADVIEAGVSPVTSTGSARTTVWPTGTGNTPQDVQLTSLVTRSGCEHKSVHDGPRVDMRWGTAPTQVCECGAWRTMLHVPGQWQTTPLTSHERTP